MAQRISLRDYQRELAARLRAADTARTASKLAVQAGAEGWLIDLMEAGEVAQNLSLLATAMGLAACALGGFLDNELAGLLGADGSAEAVLLPMIVGRPPSAGNGGGTGFASSQQGG